MSKDDKRNNRFWYREVTENNMESDVNYYLLHIHNQMGVKFQGHMLYALWQAIQDKAIRHDGYLSIEITDGIIEPMPWIKIFTYSNIPKPIGEDMIKFLEDKKLIIKEEKGKFAGCYLVPVVRAYIDKKQAGSKTAGAIAKAEQRKRKQEQKPKEKAKDKPFSPKNTVSPPY